MKKISFVLTVLFLTGLFSCVSIPKSSENGSSITFYFESEGRTVLTFWRKINEDGSKGKRFSIGGGSKMALIMNSGFGKPYSQTVKLDAGTYYLDSFETVSIVSQKAHYASRNGWDDENNKPLYMSFTISDNQNIVLPKVEIIPVRQENKKYLYNFKMGSDNKDIFTLGTLAIDNSKVDETASGGQTN
jgi:hypothetical protein